VWSLGEQLYLGNSRAGGGAGCGEYGIRKLWLKNDGNRVSFQEFE